MFDDDSDLQLNGLRWYDATVGRWLSEDPIGFAAGDANLYRYVANSPGDLVDPDGLDSIVIAAASKKPSTQSCTRKEKRMSRQAAVNRLGLYLNANEKRVSELGCVGMMSVSIMKQPSSGKMEFSVNQAKILQDRAKFFATYESAEAYYEGLRTRGRSPALFGFASNSRPFSREECSEGQQALGNDAICERYPDLQPTEELLPNEIPWAAIAPCSGGFDYVTIVNVNVDTIPGRKRTPYWMHANHSEPGMEVIFTPTEKWTDGRHLVWGVVEEPDNIWRSFDLTFEIPDAPWSTRPKEWNKADYGVEESPPFSGD